MTRSNEVLHNNRYRSARLRNSLFFAPLGAYLGLVAGVVVTNSYDSVDENPTAIDQRTGDLGELALITGTVFLGAGAGLSRASSMASRSVETQELQDSLDYLHNVILPAEAAAIEAYYVRIEIQRVRNGHQDE